MIGAEMTGRDTVLARLGAVPGRVRANVKSSLDMWAYELAGYIKASKLSGDPLKRRSGRLSSSVHPVTAESGDTITGGAGGGAGVPYAKIHEYGGIINHPGGTAFFISSLLGRAFFVSNASPSAAWLPRTAAHQITMPERSYMRSGLKDEAPRGIDLLRQAVKEAIKP